jgi:hypothetical protein
MPVILALGQQIQDDCKLEVSLMSLRYRGRLDFKTKKTKNLKEQ